MATSIVPSSAGWTHSRKLHAWGGRRAEKRPEEGTMFKSPSLSLLRLFLDYLAEGAEWRMSSMFLHDDLPTCLDPNCFFHHFDDELGPGLVKCSGFDLRRPRMTGCRAPCRS